MPVPTIFAMGGGGFTMEPENPALDEFILTLSPRREPRLLFLPTASGDGSAQVAQFHATYGDRPCHSEVLELFRLGEHGPIDLREHILSFDIVYVGGGSMRNLLAIWRVHELDVILREAWEAGVVLAGLSAGAMCWFENGVTKSSGTPAPSTGLGFLPGSLSVHADGDPERLPIFEAAIGAREIPAGYAADDGVGLLFRGAALERVVSSRPHTHAMRIEPNEDGTTTRTPLLVQELEQEPTPLRTVPGDVLEFRRARYGSSLRGD